MLRLTVVMGLLLASSAAISQTFPQGAVLHCSATDASGTCRLTSNGLTPSGSSFPNCVNIGDNTAYAMTVDIVAIDTNTPANTLSWNNWLMLLLKGATDGSTTLVTGTKPTPLTNGTTTGTAIAATADTSGFHCLNLTFTAASAVDSHVWDVVAKVSVVLAN